MNDSVVFTVDDFLHQKIKLGRYLITGSNGSGKSSLLSQLKILYPQAILLSHNSNFFDGLGSGSSGEYQVLKLKEIIKKLPEILLLDEWDSNLDVINKQKIDALINEISEKAVVVEVRHLK